MTNVAWGTFSEKDEICGHTQKGPGRWRSRQGKDGRVQGPETKGARSSWGTTRPPHGHRRDGRGPGRAAARPGDPPPWPPPALRCQPPRRSARPPTR